MAIQTYNDLYLHYIAENLGVMFEHAVDIGINPTIFWNTFINSNVAKQIEKGNPKYLTCSALDYLNEIYAGKRNIPEKEDINKDMYYWAGWILAQYQHKKGYSFYKINNNLPIEKVLANKDLTIYPSSESWYYIKNHKVYAYINFTGLTDDYEFCYNGSIEKMKRGKCS